MQFRRILCGVALALSCALGGGVAQAQTDPSLVTDQQNYLPGDTVILMGAGFQPGETVDVSIAIDDDANNVHIGDYDWMVELANDSGEFTTFWTVPLEAYGMTLRATALGLTSSRVATTTFLDDITTTDVSFRIVGMSAVVPADGFTLYLNGSPQPGFLMTNGTVFGPFSIPANTSVFYEGLPNVYTVTACNKTPGKYTTSQSTGFVSGLPGGSQIVDIVYSFATAVPPNTAPSLSASDYNVSVCPDGGSTTVTVTPAMFSPVYTDADNDPAFDPPGAPGTIAFWDGTQLTDSQTLTFGPGVTSFTLTLRATDDPSWRMLPPAQNPGGCPIPPLTTDYTVVVTASVYQQNAPVVTASNVSFPDQCGSSVTIPLNVADFGVSATDPDGDPVLAPTLSAPQVTLELPPGVSDAVVSAPVVISVSDDPSARDNGDCSPLMPMTGSTSATVSALLHRNSAPVISAGNVNLGDIVGCYSGGTFSTSVSVSAATFGATATDPEGDPVSIVADVSNVTLVGPGMATATVTLTATDDPSARTGGACSSASSSMAVQVSARIVYRYEGPLFPLNTCLATKVRRGCIVPVRFRLYDCNNVEVTTVPVNPAGGPTYHTLSVAFNQANAPDGAVDVDDLGCGDENDNFHYFLGAWTYVLLTNSTYQLHTTYIIHIYPNDGTVHNAMMSIK